MKKHLTLTIVALGLSAGATYSQSAIDAYNLSQSDLRGTARFMSMAGAFTALGGDLSVLNQNPGGIGIFRKHEIGVTVDLDMSTSNVGGDKWSMTKFNCNNFGYVGAIQLDNDVMPYFQWGVSYSRPVSFDRQYRGGWGQIGSSLTNYVAAYSSNVGYPTEELGETNTYNPYYDSNNANWLSILTYNSWAINPQNGSNNQYSGLFNYESNPENDTRGNSLFDVRERGFVDEYNISFGGNFSDVVYWGMGFGITDIQFTQETNYDEELQGARIAKSENNSAGTMIGDAYFNLNNYSHTSGTGFNYKIGLIFKPVQEFRLGIALHTPTYYKVTTTYDAYIDYDYSSGIKGRATTDYAYYDWKLRTPLKFMVGAAGVIGGKAIVSVDYEYQALKNMRVAPPYGDEYTDITSDVQTYFKNTNTIRVGAEYRLTKNFSVRAGFSTETSSVPDDINRGAGDIPVEILTSGTNPSYSFATSTRHITCGLGYRYGGFYADLAYVNRFKKSTYHPYTSYAVEHTDNSYSVFDAPWTDFTTSNNHLVLSLGYKF